jgi:hypothetical protein
VVHQVAKIEKLGMKMGLLSRILQKAKIPPKGFCF